MSKRKASGAAPQSDVFAGLQLYCYGCRGSETLGKLVKEHGGELNVPPSLEALRRRLSTAALGAHAQLPLVLCDNDVHAQQLHTAELRVLPVRREWVRAPARAGACPRRGACR